MQQQLNPEDKFKILMKVLGFNEEKFKFEIVAEKYKSETINSDIFKSLLEVDEIKEIMLIEYFVFLEREYFRA